MASSGASFPFPFFPAESSSCEKDADRLCKNDRKNKYQRVVLQSTFASEGCTQRAVQVFKNSDEVKKGRKRQSLWRVPEEESALTTLLRSQSIREKLKHEDLLQPSP